MSEWKIKSLGELLGPKGYIRGPFGSALKRGEMKSEGIPVYEQMHAIYNTREFKFYIDETKFKELSRFQVSTNDLIISCSGTVGRISIINKHDPKGIISQALLILRPESNNVRPVFLKYFLTSELGQNHLLSASHGSVQPNIAERKIVQNIPVNLPDTNEQDKIIEVLTSLDDKIDLLNRKNITLEKMAETIFRQWFVEGDIENSKTNLLGEYLDTVSSTHKFPNKEVIFLNTSDINLGEVLIHTYSEVSTLPGQAKKTIAKGDILFSEIRPANGRWAFIDFDGDNYVVSTKLMVLRAKGNLKPELLYFYLTHPLTVTYLQMLAESRSGTFPQITFDQLKDLQIRIPDQSKIDFTNNWCEQAIKNMSHNRKQIRTLKELRDTLLPKLMSGQVRVITK